MKTYQITFFIDSEQSEIDIYDNMEDVLPFSIEGLDVQELEI